MTNHLNPRFVSFGLAALATWSLVAGIDTLAIEQDLGAMQVSKAAASRQVATAKTPAPRS